MLAKEQIINEIIRTTQENSGKPLGIARFEKETGIKPYDWQRYWARFGDALEEAGFARNKLNSAYDDKALIEKLIHLIQKLKKFPTKGEVRLEKNTDPTLPDYKTFARLGSTYQIAKKVLEFCKDQTDYEDVVLICSEVVNTTEAIERNKEISTNLGIGSVYLFKSGRYYKVGKTNDTVRRGAELRIQLPEDLHLIHEIKTDDPSGIEAYWHKRFEPKRKNGEWFDLSSSEVQAFKRWKRIV